MVKKLLIICFYVFGIFRLVNAQETVKRDEVINQVFKLIQNNTKTVFEKKEVEQKQDLPFISPKIIEKADQFLISKLGEDFFKEHIVFNRKLTQFNPADQYCIKNPKECSLYLQKPYYLMVYTMRIRGKPFVNVGLEFALDEDGKLIKERDVIGVPNCEIDASKCDFVIDEQKAYELAQKAGLQGIPSEWKPEFTWHGGNLNTYVWNVSNNFGKNMGQTVIIDANNGDILDINDWEKNN